MHTQAEPNNGTEPHATINAFELSYLNPRLKTLKMILER